MYKRQEETRRDLAKEVKKVGENAKVAIRNIRRDAMDEAKKQEKEMCIRDRRRDHWSPYHSSRLAPFSS